LPLHKIEYDWLKNSILFSLIFIRNSNQNLLIFY